MYEKELAEIDSKHTVKSEAKDEMEEFLAGKGIDKPTRIGIILDYIINNVTNKEGKAVEEPKVDLKKAALVLEIKKLHYKQYMSACDVVDMMADEIPEALEAERDKLKSKVNEAARLVEFARVLKSMVPKQ